ncbi:MAG: glyceraldehyde 3-phosphate dehydrogenase N-terminal domain-containing protein, partial [Methanomassiliicoccales archaeon]|nr:glyceraldehyde 3-phosphate dehydrogenase N-terminal domain-containing protein [Methanomassiliicoccales archaeon]
MTLRVAINGFGRIGRSFLRAAMERPAYGRDFDVKVVNDLANAKTLAYLMKYDSIHGVLDSVVKATDGGMEIGEHHIRFTSEKEPAKLPWMSEAIDVVIESTGFFASRKASRLHLDAGAKKVLISAPATDPDITVVLGANLGAYDRKRHHIISMASCT